MDDLYMMSIMPNMPIMSFINLDKIEQIRSYRPLLTKKAGIYAFYNTINRKQYIGGAVDLYKRLTEHLTGVKSNKPLQSAFHKYGLHSFVFYIYEFCDKTNTSINALEDKYIQKFDFINLYNIKPFATSLLGYKHTEEAINKMKERFLIKENHPFYEKKTYRGN